MTTQAQSLRIRKAKERIFKNKVKELIKDSNKLMLEKLDRAFNSGVFDVMEFEENWILPKSILLALAKEIEHQYSAKGTSFEKQVRKLSNIIYNSI